MILNESGAVINNAGDIITGISNNGGTINNYGTIGRLLTQNGITNSFGEDGSLGYIYNARTRRAR